MDQTTVQQFIKSLPRLRGVTRIECLEKGFSTDIKWILWEEGIPAYLLRLRSIQRRARLDEEFGILREHHSRGTACPEPLDCGVGPDDKHCYLLTSYIRGVSAEERLAVLSPQAQYDLGLEAGALLKALHGLLHLDPGFDWPARRVEKYESRLEEVHRLGLRFFRMEETEAYIKQRLPLLPGSPVRFQHDDFHPGNLIASDDGRLYVIDFNRFDWGDPIEDFFKVPKYTCPTSIPFARGQIDGYCDGAPSLDFWRRYNLFVALNMHSSVIGAHFLYRDQFDIWQRRIAQIVETHDFEDDGPPDWYLGRA